MLLLPKPKEITCGKGSNMISRDCRIILHSQCSFKDYEAAKLLQGEIEALAGIRLKITKSFSREGKKCIFIYKKYNIAEGYSLKITEDSIEINGGDEAGVFYGIQSLRQIIRINGIELPCLIINDEPYFKHRGFYHDVTRGKVPTLETLKELVDRASFYKLNQLQLYIEHSFAFKGLSEVWIDKDPLTAEEIIELDGYCRERSVELVPSLSTFGHLYEVLRSKSYNELCELNNSSEEPYSWIHRQMHHTLDVTNPNSIKLVEEMLKEFIPLFSSDKFNICCDETFDLGKGKSKSVVERQGVGKLYADFLTKVISLVKSNNKKVMFWGDIVLEHKELIDAIPKDVICLNWNYSANPREEDTKSISDSGLMQYVCPGVSGWNRLINGFDVSFSNISKMIEYGKKYGALGVLNTDWGDFGHVNLLASSMPGMIYGAALSWNPDTEKNQTAIDKSIARIEYGDKAETLMQILRQLAHAEKCSWSYLGWWKEEKLIKDFDFSSLFEYIRNIDQNEFLEGYAAALEAEKALSKKAFELYPVSKKDIREFIVSARGIALINALFLVIKRKEIGDSHISLAVGPKELAEKLEYWFYDYSQVWRIRNKESELYRIRDFIQYICNFLRSQ